MLNRNIFIAHTFGFIFGIDQNLVEIIADIDLTAAAHLRKPRQFLLSFVDDQLFRNAHLGQKLQDQTIIQRQEAVKQMLLFDLLVTILVRQLLTSLNGFHGFLSKFIYVHSSASILQSCLCAMVYFVIVEI